MTYVGGSQSSLAGQRYAGIPTNEVVWKDMFEFDAVLSLDGMTRGRSAARFIWSDKEGRKYEMFMADMLGLVQSGAVIERGCCDAKWTFTKKGANYGIKVVA